MKADKIIDYISWGLLFTTMLILRIATPYVENIIHGKRFVWEFAINGMLWAILWFFSLYKLRKTYFDGEEKRASAILSMGFSIIILSIFIAAFYNHHTGWNNLYQKKALLLSKNGNVWSNNNYAKVQIGDRVERFKLSNKEWDVLKDGDSLNLKIGKGGCNYEFIYQFSAHMSKRKTGSNQVTREYVELMHKEGAIEPPPPGMTVATATFTSLEEWLTNICNNDKPKKHIATYKFGVFESMNDYFVFLVGLNEHNFATHSETRTDFEPKDMYFPLPTDAYKGLSRQQVFARLTFQLKYFTSTETFKRSFLTRADSVTTEFAGTIWKK